MPRFTTSDGVDLHYEERMGNGAVVVLVHGYVADMHDWDECLPHLPTDWRIVRLDLRGVGQSGRPEGGYTIARYAQDVFELTTALGLPPFTLIGHSMGGAIAAQFAVDQQARLRGLVLVAPARLDGVPPPDPATQAALDQLREDVPLLTEFWRTIYARPPADPRLAGVVQTLLDASEGHRTESIDSMVALRLYDHLPQLTVPTLIVGGDRDTLVPTQSMLEAYALIPGCGLQIFHRVGHVVQVEVPQAFAAVVTDFVLQSARPGDDGAGRVAADASDWQQRLASMVAVERDAG